MYGHIGISLWILFIVFCGSYGLNDGNYRLDSALVPYLSEEILKEAEPKLHKSGDNYSIMYRAQNANEGIKQIQFKLSGILIMITTEVFIETDQEFERIVLDFALLDTAQKMCLHYAKQINLDRRKEYDLIEVLNPRNNARPVILSPGQLWIDPYLDDDFRRFTIVETENHLPYFIFDTHDFNVSPITNESNLFIKIHMNGENYKYQLKFATPREAVSFHKLVTEKSHIEPTIRM